MVTRIGLVVINAEKPMASDGRSRVLESTLANLTKRFGEGAIMRLGEASHLQVDVIPTGSLALDLALGVGGVPRGRVIEIYGPEASGKTTICQHIVAEAQKMGGLAAKMPVTGATNLVASLSIAGIPPFNGFWSKLIIIIAAVQAGRFGYAFWAVLASILTLASFMKVMKYGFYGKLGEGLSRIKEVPLFMKLSMPALAVLCVIGGLLLMPQVFGPFLNSASKALLAGSDYARIVLGSVR